LDRSEHFNEKQHGGYGTSFYIRHINALIHASTPGTECLRRIPYGASALQGWVGRGTPSGLGGAKCSTQTIDIL
jgi:hypothetical protein